MYVGMSVCLYLSVCYLSVDGVYLCLYVCLYVCMSVCIYVCVRIHVRMHAYILSPLHPTRHYASCWGREGQKGARERGKQSLLLRIDTGCGSDLNGERAKNRKEEERRGQGINTAFCL